MQQLFSKTRCSIAGVVLGSFITATVHATPIAYTDFAAFSADLVTGGLSADTLNFDSLASSTLIADGDTVDGITFSYPTLASFGVTMQVRNDFDTTSAPNFLGTDDSGVFQDGDDFGLSFGPVNAIGMYFITVDQMFDEDIFLIAGGETASLQASAVQQTLPDGGNVFFLGIIDTMASFTSATVQTSQLGNFFFLYNVDDIMTAALAPAPAPAPGTILLLGIGFAGLAGARRQRKKAMDCQVKPASLTIS